MVEHRHIGGIDIVRFVAAVLVMNFHLVFAAGFRGTSFAVSGGVASFTELSYFTWFGGVGVQVFFVVSGFVIAYSARGKTPEQFFQSRFWRIFPSVWICAPVSALALAIVGVGFAGMGPDILLLRTMVLYPFYPWVDGVYWSLVVEMVFYSVVFVLLLMRPRADWFGALAIVMAGSSLTYFGSRLMFGLPPVSMLFLLQDGHYFALGITIWLIRENGWKLSYIVLIFATVLTTYLELDSQRAGRPTLLFWSWFTAWFVCSALVLVSALCPVRGNSFTRMLGLMTYPLYLLHNIVGSSLLRLAPDIGRWWALLLAYTVAFLLAYLVVRLEPFIRIALTSIWTTLRPARNSVAQ